MAVAQQPTKQPLGSNDFGGAPDAMLRRVAIVLSSLPAHVSNRLMASLSSATRNSLRSEIGNLADIDPLERRRAFQAFKGSLVQQQLMVNEKEASSDSHDTFVSGTSSHRFVRSNANGEPIPSARASRIDDRMAAAVGHESHSITQSGFETSAANQSQKRSEMDFLADIEDEILARVIVDEHPQAIALVLASIAPAQAARIVTTLEPRLQSDALNRIARLSETSEEAIADLSEHLRSKVQRLGAQSFARSGSDAGQNALQAILDAMPIRKSSPTQTLANEEDFADQSPAHEENLHARMVDESFSPGTAKEQGVAETERPDTAAQEDLSSAAGDASDQSIEELASPQLAAVHVNPFESTDAIHNHLIQLSPKDLCSALAQVETRQALLVLCGLPNQVVDKVMSALPRSQAKQVRGRLGSLGNLQLREIDEAKEKVALISVGAKTSGSDSTRATKINSASSPNMPMAA